MLKISYKLFLLFVIYFFGFAALAQFDDTELSTTTAAIPSEEPALRPDLISSQGFRVGILKPDLKFELNYGSGSVVTSVNDFAGVSLGYVSLPEARLGFSASFAYLASPDRSEGRIVRLDFNLIYSFSSLWNVKAGLNLTRFSTPAIEFSENGGMQASLGYQVTPHLGIDVGYVQMTQDMGITGPSITAKESGVEVGLNHTF